MERQEECCSPTFLLCLLAASLPLWAPHPQAAVSVATSSCSIATQLQQNSSSSALALPTWILTSAIWRVRDTVANRSECGAEGRQTVLARLPHLLFDDYRTGIVGPTMLCCSLISRCFCSDGIAMPTQQICGVGSQTHPHSAVLRRPPGTFPPPACSVGWGHSHAGVCAADRGLGLYRDFLLGLWEFRQTHTKFPCQE